MTATVPKSKTKKSVATAPRKPATAARKKSVAPRAATPKKAVADCCQRPEIIWSPSGDIGRWKTDHATGVLKIAAYTPSETDEHIVVADWLRANGIFFLHVPNEAKRSRGGHMLLERMGLLKGAPDFLIFDVHGRISARGVAVELKRQPSLKAGRVGVAGQSAAPRTCVSREINWPSVGVEQVQVLKELEKRGWITTICYGAQDTIGFLRNHLPLTHSIPRLEGV